MPPQHHSVTYRLSITDPQNNNIDDEQLKELAAKIKKEIFIVSDKNNYGVNNVTIKQNNDTEQKTLDVTYEFKYNAIKTPKTVQQYSDTAFMCIPETLDNLDFKASELLKDVHFSLISRRMGGLKEFRLEYFPLLLSRENPSFIVHYTLMNYDPENLSLTA